MTPKISIRVARSGDHDALIEFLREYYYREEPLTLSHPIHGVTIDDERFTMQNLKYGTVLIACDENADGKIAGAIVAGPLEHGDADKMIEDAKTTETEKWRDISLFLAYIEKKADVLNRFHLESCLHIHAVGVHQGYRGQKIGEKLFAACFENGLKLKYRLVSVDCSSIYSIKICVRLGMENVQHTTYDEYHDKLGRKLFTPTPPNMEIQTFVKRLDVI